MSRRDLARAVRDPLEMLGPFDGRQVRLTGDQARSAAVRQEAPGPSDDHDEPVGVADEKDDVDAEPHSPSEEAAHLAEPSEPAYVGHARQASDHRYVRPVSVSERLGCLAEPGDAAAFYDDTVPAVAGVPIPFRRLLTVYHAIIVPGNLKSVRRLGRSDNAPSQGTDVRLQRRTLWLRRVVAAS